jgi:DMSO/TMAO reductase YedYZ molybdopterin-dependent catalytic subunit
MGFFDRNRKALIAKGIDPARLPPGQYSTDRFPVLHVGDVPEYRDLSTWSLRVFGAVEQPFTLGWDELLGLGSVDITVDIHCVTKWSKFDTVWRGVPLDTVLAAAGVDPAATHLIEHAENGYTTNVPLSEVRGVDAHGQPRAILAHLFDGEALAPDHGYPLRLVVPSLYFWKSAKWLRGLELSVGDQPGFWERNGYHNVGDPFREERFGVW